MSSLNILLICRDAKTKDAKVRISLHLYFFIREYHRQTRNFKKTNHFLQVWVREELELFQRGRRKFRQNRRISFFLLIAIGIDYCKQAARNGEVSPSAEALLWESPQQQVLRPGNPWSTFSGCISAVDSASTLCQCQWRSKVCFVTLPGADGKILWSSHMCSLFLHVWKGWTVLLVLSRDFIVINIWPALKR